MAPASPCAPASPPIPFSRLNFEVLQELAFVLEPMSPLSMPGDWRNLAHHLQFEMPFINFIMSKDKKDGSCTLEMFREYSKREGNSVEQVMSALEKMKHWKAHQILKDAYPVVREEYDNLLEQKTAFPMHLEEKRRCDHASVRTKRHCADSTTPNMAAVRMREAQENSHHSLLSQSPRRGPHREQPTAHLLPHITIFNQPSVKPQSLMSLESMETCSMTPQCDSLNSEMQMDNDKIETDINHNGIYASQDDHFLPMEVGLIRHMQGDQCDIGAEEEVVTSTTSECDSCSLPPSPPQSARRCPPFQVKQSQQEQKVQWVNRNMQSGGQVTHSCIATHAQQQSVSLPHRNPLNTYPRIKQQAPVSMRAASLFGSVPGDMKINKFSEASRKIRIFITYANDSQAHVEHVVSLAECLQNNKFSVSIDMYEFKLMAMDKVGWLETKFKKADFILVCISEQYKTDVETCDSESSQSLDHTLNTKFIYKLMQTEYHERASTNYRFIPLLFPGVTKDDVPTWLQNTLIYNWPSQYRDLFFFLSKPDRLINTSLRQAMVSGGISRSNGVHPTIVTRSYSTENTSPKSSRAHSATSMTSPKIKSLSFSDSSTSADNSPLREVMI